MDLKQLDYFVKTAEAKGFSRAASQLNIAQSALSRQIRLLEEELDVVLLTRHGRGVELTPAGKRLFDQAQSLLQQARQMRDTVIAEATEPHGELHLGLPAGLATNVGADILLALRERFPRIQVKIVVGPTARMRELLTSSQLDIGILGAGESEERIEIEPLRAAKLHLVGAPGSLKSFGSKLALNRIMELPMVMNTRIAAVQRLAAAAEDAGRRINTIIETDYLPLGLRLVERGLGFAILPFDAISEEIEGGLLDAMPVPQLGFQWSIGLPRGKAASPAVRAAQGIIRELMSDAAPA